MLSIPFKHGCIRKSDEDFVISYLINAVPAIIPDESFGLDSPDTNNDEYHRAKHDDAWKTTDSGKYYLVQYGDTTGGHFALLDRRNEDVLYVMDYEVSRILGKTCVTQTKLWRKDSSIYRGESIAGQKVHIFVFDFLIRTFDAVITDSLQTEDGKRFWMNRLENAFASGQIVYKLEEIDEKLVPERLHSFQNLLSLEGHIWGIGAEYMKRRVAIAKSMVW